MDTDYPPYTFWDPSKYLGGAKKENKKKYTKIFLKHFIHL